MPVRRTAPRNLKTWLTASGSLWATSMAKQMSTMSEQTDWAPIQQAFTTLVEQQGKRDPLNAQRTASVILELDEGHDMVVTAVIHDLKREHKVAWIATTIAVVSVLAMLVSMGFVLSIYPPWSK